MWRLSGWLFLPVFVAVACTHTLQTNPTRPENLPALQRRLDGKDLKVVRTGGTGVRVPDARVTAEGVGGISWSEIRAVEYRDHLRGALEGLGIGAGLGVAGAVVLGVVATGSSHCASFLEGISLCGPEAGFILGLAVGLIYGVPLGGGAGLLVGAVKGSKIRVVSHDGHRAQE